MPAAASPKKQSGKKFANSAAWLGLFIFGLFVFGILTFTSPKKARAAHCSINCVCVQLGHALTRSWITAQHGVTKLHIGNEMINHRNNFLGGYFFNEHILAAMMMMTEQLVSTGMHQTLMIGAFLDAKHQLETQRLLQTMMARAHKDYHPDTEMCVIGTHTKSLASAQQRGITTSYILGQMGLERSLNNANTNSAEGQKENKEGRLELFKTTFCDEQDNGARLGALCDGSGPPESQNMDVDYAGLIDRPWTINADFTTPAANLQDNAVTAMYQNLYGHNVLNPIAPRSLKDQSNHDILLDVRALAAKRAVAQNSFAALVGQKARGSPESESTQKYMGVLLKEFGITDDDEVTAIIGERPSYYAQMEMLTKQIFMREQFYTNLYDKPVNIDRKGAAIQAVNLVQNMDMFESKLRNEELLAILVEIELEKVQESVENRINKLDEEGSLKQTPN